MRSQTNDAKNNFERKPSSDSHRVIYNEIVTTRGENRTQEGDGFTYMLANLLIVLVVFRVVSHITLTLKNVSLSGFPEF